jgi:hypothetical protein
MGALLAGCKDCQQRHDDTKHGLYRDL